MPIPIVCVGNITLGGAGKTPTVIFLAKYLTKNNIKAHVVSRGYGGRFKDTVFVDRRTHSAYEVGVFTTFFRDCRLKTSISFYV